MSGSEATIPGTTVHRLRSEEIDQEFEVRVAAPRTAPRGLGPEVPSVVYVLDGDLYFGTVTEMTRLMHQLFHELPPLLVVAVGYGTDEPRIQGELRNRDFTPTQDPAFEALGRRMFPDWKPLLPDGERMGGADRFLEFLTSQVKPFVEETYTVRRERSTIFGASLGGLFALYTMLTRPTAFTHYVISSPAIWWDGEMLFDVEERLAGGASDLDARVFMGVGSLEEGLGIPHVDAMRTVTNVGKMTERLHGRDYPSLSLSAHVFPDETHTSVVPAVLTRGLRTLLGPASG